MAQFTTISPTHVGGQKPAAWSRFRDGGYVAIGWLNDTDLSGKSPEEVAELVRQQDYDNEAAAIQSFERFLSLKPGDYIAVNNTAHGLFGIGVIQSGYKFDRQKHDCGEADDAERFYPHYRDVKWLKTDYMSRSALVSEGETPWQPYGTVGKVYSQLPPYISRVLGVSPPPIPEDKTERPAEFKQVLDAVEVLRKQRSHQERAHESLVEDFFVSLGYAKHRDIKYRQGRVDISIETGGRTVLIVEVKAAWDLSYENGIDAIKQAYQYAHDQGVRYVIVTNGDTYVLFDRLKGLSWESNLLGEFKLTALDREGLALIDRLRPVRLGSTDFNEALRHLAESFPGGGSAG